MAGSRGTSLRQYALTRLALVVPMIFILLTLVFLLMRVAPGDPITASLGGHVPPAVVNQIKGSDKIESIRIEGDTAPLLAAQAERVKEWDRALGA